MDPACFDDFFRREYPLLVKVVMAVGGTLEEAHDAVGETMADLWRRWSTVREPRAYARTAVKNCFFKQRKRERAGLEKAVRGGHLTPEADECAELSVWEDRQWVGQLIGSLPTAQREVVEAVLAGMAVEQIAEVFGRTPATIRRRLERATHRLAELRDGGTP